MPSESRLAVIDCGSNSFRLVVFTYTDTWWKRTDEIHEAVRVGEGLEGSGALQPEPMERALETLELYAHFCAATGIDEIRPVATSAIRDASQPGRVPGRGARAVRARDRGPARAGRGALRLPGGGELDDAVRRRRAGSGRRLDAAHARGRPARGRRALVAAGRRAHDRALRAREEEAHRGAARARRGGARERRLARRRRRGWSAVGGTVRNLAAAAQLAAGHALLRHPGLPGHARRARRPDRGSSPRARRAARCPASRPRAAT